MDQSTINTIAKGLTPAAVIAAPAIKTAVVTTVAAAAPVLVPVAAVAAAGAGIGWLIKKALDS